MLSENTDQNREGCTKCVVWALENENRRNVKSNFEVILPLIFAALTKDRVPGIKKKYIYGRNGIPYLSNYHRHII